MRRQRYAYTLPPQEDSVIPYEQDDVSTVLSSHISLQDPMWSQMFSPSQDPIIPCYLYQYPVLQIPSEQYQSISSVMENASFSMNSYDSLSYFGETVVDSQDFNKSLPISYSGHGDGLISEIYTYEEVQGDAVQNLPLEIPDTYPMVTNYGAVTILLRHLVRVDISPEKSVYVTNVPAECVIAVNSKGDQSCVIHPNGRVFHDNEDIHMATLNKKAKMSRRGIVFTSSNHCLSFLVDASGTKTTSEKFRDLNRDFSYEVFYDGSFATNSIDQCYKIVEAAAHKTYKNGDEVWILGGFRIKQDQWGDIKVSRNFGRRVIRASPTTGQVHIKTDSVEIDIGRYHNNYFIVRRADKVVTACLRRFTVQSGTQRAGFNSTGRLVLK